MWIKPAFFLVINISVREERCIRLFFALPLFWLNDFVESIADIAAFLNIITFGRLKIFVSKNETDRMSIGKATSALYTVSDVLTELSLFTGRFDLVNIKVDSQDEKVKVKIFTV